MNIIDLDDLKAAVEGVALATGRTQHVSLTLGVKFYKSVANEPLTIDWRLYVEDIGQAEASSLIEVLERIQEKLTPKNYLQKAEQLEADAKALRALVGGSQ